MIPKITEARAAAMQRQWLFRTDRSSTTTWDMYFNYARCSGENAITGSTGSNRIFSNKYLWYYHNHTWTELYPLADATYYYWEGRVDGDTITALRVENPYGVWRSTDNGANWDEIFPDGGSRTDRHNFETSGGKIVIYKASTTTYYKYNGSTWETKTFPSIPSVFSMSGDKMLIIGADGKLYLYNGTSWVEQTFVTPDTGQQESWQQVGISGDYMFATLYHPAVYYVYVYDGTSRNDDYIGAFDYRSSVSIDGRYIYQNGGEWYDILIPDNHWSLLSDFAGAYQFDGSDNIITAASGDNIIALFKTTTRSEGVYKLYGKKRYEFYATNL